MWEFLKSLFNVQGIILLLCLIFSIDVSDMDDSSDDKPEKAGAENTRESNIPANDAKVKKN